nr:hypothetical protein [Tanacetum cinerariifolium]
MAAPVISISLDVSVEIVGSSFPRVILIGFIFVELPVAPKVEAVVVASPVGVLELDTHSSSEADPSKRSDTEIPKKRVSPTTFAPEILTAPILPTPPAIVAPSFEFPLAPVALTVRKSVRPLPSHRLALRYTSYHLDRFTSGSSLSHSSSDHSSSGHSSSGHSLSRHTPPDTTDADSSSPQRFVHPSLARTPRCSETYLCWRSSMLSTMYPPRTSESLAGDSSFESFAGPSRKRCRSPATTATSSIHSTRALVPSRVDLLPPRKRFRDSISPEDIVEEDIDTDVLEDIKADATSIEVAVDWDVEARIDAGIGMEVNVGINVEDEVEDEVESSDRGTMEVRLDVVTGIDIPDEIALQRIEDIETTQRQLEVGQLIASRERAGLSDRTRSLERENLKV